MDNWLVFLLASAVILVTPGITIVYVVERSLSCGSAAALPLSAGVVVGDALCLLISFFAGSALLTLFPGVLQGVQILGAGYLLYLGLTNIFRNARGRLAVSGEPAVCRKLHLFSGVLLITLLNPKGILFFSAYLPQFIHSDEPVGRQFMLLAATFLLLAFINTLIYALFSAQAGKYLYGRRFHQLMGYGSGTIFVILGLYSLTRAAAT